MKQTLLGILLFSAPILYAQTGFKVVGYLPTYRFGDLANIHLERCTHINIAFANPDAQGNLTTDGISIAPAVAAAKQQHCTVLISLAGGYLAPAVQANWDSLLLPANRPAYVQKIVQYVLANNLDGVDVDLEWQYVNSYYSPFVLDLKTALAAQNKLLTAALPGSHRYPEVSNAALAAFDWVNMMVYDLTGPWAPNNPGQHAPYNWAVQCIQYWKNQGVPASRLTLGVPFYGYNFATSPVSSFKFQSMVALDTAYAYLDQVDLRFYNGIPTIQAKTQLALNEVAGIMIWELGQDALNPALAQYSLLKAISDVAHPAVAAGEPLFAAALPLYPNPASDWVRLPAAERVAVFDLNGRLLMTQTGADAGGQVLDVQTLPAGLYVVQAWNGGAMRAGRLVKN